MSGYNCRNKCVLCVFSFRRNSGSDGAAKMSSRKTVITPCCKYQSQSPLCVTTTSRKSYQVVRCRRIWSMSTSRQQLLCRVIDEDQRWCGDVFARLSIGITHRNLAAWSSPDSDTPVAVYDCNNRTSGPVAFVLAHLSRSLCDRFYCVSLTY